MADNKPETTEEKKPTSILLEWTGDNIKYIADKVFLNTGNNEVSVADWERLRWMVADLIVPEGTRLSDADKAAGRIIEIGAEVIPSKASPSAPARVRSAKQLKDLSAEEAEVLVRDTNNLATLTGWKKLETRDSVRVAIIDQIDVINGVKKDK